MMGTIFWEWHISWGFRHCKSCCFWSRFNRLDIAVVHSRAWCFFIFWSQQTSITLRHRKLGCFIRWRQVNEFLFKISTWSLRISHIKMLFHAFITGSFPFVVFIEEPMRSLWMILLTDIWNWVFLMVLIFCSRYCSHLFGVCEISLGSITNTDSVALILLRICWQKSIRQRGILVWQLFGKLSHMGRQVESFISADTILFTRVCSIVCVGVFCWWWGWWSLEVNITAREPC